MKIKYIFILAALLLSGCAQTTYRPPYIEPHENRSIELLPTSPYQQISTDIGIGGDISFKLPHGWQHRISIHDDKSFNDDGLVSNKLFTAVYRGNNNKQRVDALAHEMAMHISWWKKDNEKSPKKYLEAWLSSKKTKSIREGPSIMFVQIADLTCFVTRVATVETNTEIQFCLPYFKEKMLIIDFVFHVEKKIYMSDMITEVMSSIKLPPTYIDNVRPQVEQFMREYGLTEIPNKVYPLTLTRIYDLARPEYVLALEPVRQPPQKTESPETASLTDESPATAKPNKETSPKDSAGKPSDPIALTSTPSTTKLNFQELLLNNIVKISVPSDWKIDIDYEAYGDFTLSKTISAGFDGFIVKVAITVIKDESFKANQFISLQSLKEERILVAKHNINIFPNEKLLDLNSEIIRNTHRPYVKIDYIFESDDIQWTGRGFSMTYENTLITIDLIGALISTKKKQLLSDIIDSISIAGEPLDSATQSVAQKNTSRPTPAPASQPKELPATELFAQIDPSVYVIATYNDDKKQIQGSGVAIAPDKLFTNCHVVEDTGVAAIGKDDEFIAYAILLKKESQPKQDLCLLKTIPDENGKIVKLNALKNRKRKYSSLKVGETVYAVGSPSGLENTLSPGIVSGLRKDKGARWIQTTAPIAPGSSGGGLFDAQGRLIGITTFMIQETGNLNFAAPVE